MAENEGISKGGCIGALIVVGFAVAVLLIATCTVKVPADKIGVRTMLTSSGVEEKDYDPGYVLAIPGLHRVTLWDITWTNLKETLHIRASDQYSTQVDISVLVRIQPRKCHLVAKTYRDEEHINQLVRTTLNKYANEILAQMKTEDFYNTRMRDLKADETEQAMNQQLSKEGVEIKNVLIRNIVYDPRFEQQLLQKQLAGQRKSLEISKGLLAAAQTETELIRRKAEAEVKRIDESKRQEIENLTAETDRKIAQIAQDAKLDAATIVAKAESARRQQIAESELKKAAAQATGTAALSRAYTRPGARYYFAQQALEGLSLGEIEVNSNTFNPLDLTRLLEALGLNLQAPHSPLPAAGGGKGEGAPASSPAKTTP